MSQSKTVILKGKIQLSQSKGETHQDKHNPIVPQCTSGICDGITWVPKCLSNPFLPALLSWAVSIPCQHPFILTSFLFLYLK